MKINNLLNTVIKEISLSKQEQKKLNDIAKKVISELKKDSINAFIGGSLAKKTLIKNASQDIDIFVVFENEANMNKLEESIKKSFPEFKKIHGSRDYFQIFFDDIKIELIPTLKIKDPSKAKNITDISLSHVKYVTSKIKKNKKLADEIKLAKAFCQAQNCYGAESYIKGFSGYSLEVLIIHFKSFINFLKKINKQKIIDPEKQFENKNQVLYELNSSKISGPLIVIDPTYKYRNICAGLTQETFQRFIESKERFLLNPSINFFKKTKLDVNNLKQIAKTKKAQLYKINIKTNKQEGDIAGTKMKKFFDFLCNELKRNKQEVLQKEFYYSGKENLSAGYIIIKHNPTIEIKGPPLSMQESVNTFIKFNKNTLTKDNHIWARKQINLLKIFESANKVKDEMGAGFEKIEKL